MELPRTIRLKPNTGPILIDKFHKDLGITTHQGGYIELFEYRAGKIMEYLIDTDSIVRDIEHITDTYKEQRMHELLRKTIDAFTGLIPYGGYSFLSLSAFEIQNTLDNLPDQPEIDKTDLQQAILDGEMRKQVKDDRMAFLSLLINDYSSAEPFLYAILRGKHHALSGLKPAQFDKIKEIGREMQSHDELKLLESQSVTLAALAVNTRRIVGDLMSLAGFHTNQIEDEVKKILDRRTIPDIEISRKATEFKRKQLIDSLNADKNDIKKDGDNQKDQLKADKKIDDLAQRKRSIKDG